VVASIISLAFSGLSHLNDNRKYFLSLIVQLSHISERFSLGVSFVAAIVLLIFGLGYFLYLTGFGN
jgi:hypothetical protein